MASHFQGIKDYGSWWLKCWNCRKSWPVLSQMGNVSPFEKIERAIDLKYGLWSFACGYIPLFSNFKDVCKKIFRRLYRVFVHVYIEHFERWATSFLAKMFHFAFFHCMNEKITYHYFLPQTPGRRSWSSHKYILQAGNTPYRPTVLKIFGNISFFPQTLLILYERASTDGGHKQIVDFCLFK